MKVVCTFTKVVTKQEVIALVVEEMTSLLKADLDGCIKIYHVVKIAFI